MPRTLCFYLLEICTSKTYWLIQSAYLSNQSNIFPDTFFNQICLQCTAISLLVRVQAVQGHIQNFLWKYITCILVCNQFAFQEIYLPNKRTYTFVFYRTRICLYKCIVIKSECRAQINVSYLLYKRIVAKIVTKGLIHIDLK